MKRWHWGAVVLLVSGAGCAQTVLRPGYACIRVALNQELEAAAVNDPEKFQAMLEARTKAGTCVPLTAGQQVRVVETTLDGQWLALLPPSGPNAPDEYLWARAGVLGSKAAATPTP